MGRAEFQAKKGLNGSRISMGSQTFNKSTGVAKNNPNSPQTQWHGTTKGGTKSKSGKGS